MRKYATQIWKRLLCVVLYEVFLWVALTFAGLFLMPPWLDPWILTKDIAVMIVVDSIVVFGCTVLSGLHKVVFRNVGIQEALKVLVTAGMVFLCNTVFRFVFHEFSLRYAALSALFFVLFSSVFLFAVRTRNRLKVSYTSFRSEEMKRVMIIGAGMTGAMLADEMLIKPELRMRPVCFVDDDPSLSGSRLHGIPVAGPMSGITAYAERYCPDLIVVSIPSATRRTLADIYSKCSKTGVEVKTMPGIDKVLSGGPISLNQLRNVDVQDLLGREEIKVNMEEIRMCITGKTVLVTGGGGSIGSELCRQIAVRNPKQLIIFDIYENNAYDIEQELRRSHPELNLLVLIGSIRDKGKVEDLFRTYRPQIVFNAAAHKHVPLMETSPNEAVKNNVFGTLNVARAADKYAVERFVQISTDKAVNPTNVMGATKRICEMIIQTVGRHSEHTNFVAVRFGNVLGSNGSVIPLFRKQIAEGGPVTVTDENIVRYFMTIPEAVSLVLQACCYAQSGEIYVFDMGDPVRIYDLAENLIRLSGLEPGVDIEIKCTGLRPGEKLYEERLMDEEGMKRTANDKISVGKPLEFDEENFFRKLDELYEAAYAETDRMKYLVRDLVPTYHIDESRPGSVPVTTDVKA